MKKKKISQKEQQRRNAQSQMAKYGSPLIDSEGGYMNAVPVKSGYKLEKI